MLESFTLQWVTRDDIMTEEEKQIIIRQINKGNSLKEFTCPCCDITFTNLYDFRKHLFKKHKTEWNECFEKRTPLLPAGTIRARAKEKQKRKEVEIEAEYEYLLEIQKKMKTKSKRKRKRERKQLQQLELQNKPEIASYSRDFEKTSPRITNLKEGMFTTLSKEEVKTGRYIPSFIKTTKPTQKKKTEFVRIIYTPMGNKR